MTETFQLVLTSALSMVTGGGLASIVNAVMARRKSIAESKKAESEANATDIGAAVSLAKAWSDLLEPIRNEAARLATKLKLLDEENGRLRAENARLEDRVATLERECHRLNIEVVDLESKLGISGPGKE